MAPFHSESERFIQDYSSRFYDVRYSGYGQRYHTEIVQWLTKELKGHVLDAGCGTGFVSRVRPDLDITGIDLSPEMLRRYTGMTSHLMDVCTMPESWTNAFDGIICRSLLHHLPDHQRGLKEMSRVTKSGGRIVFWETNQSYLASLVRARTQHGDRFSAYHHSFRDTELCRDIRQWFAIDEVKYLGYLQYPLYGFPDILNFAKWIPFNSFLYRCSGFIDRYLSEVPWLRRWSWSIGIKARKV